MDGISIVMCCYNSEWVVKYSLDAIIRQKFRTNLKWELVVVNNASTDNTEKVVEDILQQSGIDYKIVTEKKAGLVYARETGVRRASYSCIIFCDDDNILSLDYVENAYWYMHTHPQCGACGGLGKEQISSSEVSPIIYKYLHCYAIGPQNVNTNALYGAGLCIRKHLLESIYNSDIELLLLGRKGSRLLAGDDSEIIKLVILKGYKIAFNENMVFSHMLPQKRLSVEYLKKMVFGFGLTLPILSIYDAAICNSKCYLFYFLLKYVKFVMRFIITMLLLCIKKGSIVDISYYWGGIRSICMWSMRDYKKVINNIQIVNDK